MVLYIHSLNFMKFLNYLIYIFFTILVFTGCANIATLSGGPKDLLAPRMDSLKSTPNFQTRYKPLKVNLHFDEWIILKNQDQILVSPPVPKKPKVKQKGKHISIEFDKKDTLRENTTYNMNFGNSICDFTEGNPVSNFSFVFSTGDKIDSLEFEGKVLNSYENKPEKDFLVMLYDQKDDSVVIKSEPYYFAYTNESGSFRITNIREGLFKVFVLKDANANFLYDNVSEKIGFIDTMVRISADTLKSKIEIKVFQPDIAVQIKDKNIADYGKISLALSRKPDSLKILNSTVKILEKESIKDSVFVWFDTSEPFDSIQLVIKIEDKTDSLNIKQRKKFNKPAILKALVPKGIVSIHPDKAILLDFNQPVFLIDTTGIEISDTGKVRQVFTVKNDSLNLRQFRINGNWKDDMVYSITVLPGVFKGLHNQFNDSISMNFRTLKRSDFGTLICQIDSLDTETQYIIQLKQKENIIAERIIRDKSVEELKFPGLEPGNYMIDVIIDDNKNGRWNGGNYFRKLQSEKTLKFQLNELKKNWDQVEKLSIKQGK